MVKSIHERTTFPALELKDDFHAACSYCKHLDKCFLIRASFNRGELPFKNLCDKVDQIAALHA